MGLDIAQLLRLVSWRAFDVTPDGRVLAGSDAAGSVQLVELTPENSTNGDPETPISDPLTSEFSTQQLTVLSGSVTGRYLPQQRSVLVQHDTDGDERTQLSVLDLARDPRTDSAHAPSTAAQPAPDGAGSAQPTARLIPLIADVQHVHRLLDVLDEHVVYATNRRDGVSFDVICHELATGGERVVHQGDGMVNEVAVSADGNHVAITVPGTESLADQLLLIDPGRADEPTRTTALTSADEPARHTRPRWGPDGALVVTSDLGRDHTAIARIAPRAGARRWLVPSADEPTTESAQAQQHDLSGWLAPNGHHLLVMTNVDGSARLAVHDAHTGRHIREVRVPDAGWCGYPLPDPVFSADSRHVAVSWSSPTTPGDVLLVETATGRTRAVTDSHRELRDLDPAEQLARPRTHRIPTRDGQYVPALVYAPHSTATARRGSAVVMVHGGPESQSVHTFNPIAQALVTRGHTVVLPNVRGSTGYGKRWYSADDRRARMSAVDDLADVHAWLPEIGADPARAALWGGSYGGYMVLAGLAFQPELWAAGVDIVGISSLVTFLENTAPYRRAHREREYGSLTADADFLRAMSPLQHADRIVAPLFVLHGANDPRVPLSEAQQIAEAVRGNGQECELLVYSDEGHGLTKRGNKLQAYPRALNFLDRHLTHANQCARLL